MAAAGQLTWNNVTAGDENAGQAYGLQASKLQLGATDPLMKELAKYNTTQDANVKSQSEANTASIIEQIRAGKTPERTGFYNGGAISEAKYGYEKDQQALAFKRRAEGRAIAAAGRAAAAHRQRMRGASSSASSTKNATAQRQAFNAAMANGLKTESRQELASANPHAPVDRGVSPEKFVFDKYGTNNYYDSSALHDNLNMSADDFTSKILKESGATNVIDGMSANDILMNQFRAEDVAVKEGETPGVYDNDFNVFSKGRRHPGVEGFGSAAREREANIVDYNTVNNVADSALDRQLSGANEKIDMAPTGPISNEMYSKTNEAIAIDKMMAEGENRRKNAIPEWGAPTKYASEQISAGNEAYGTQADIVNQDASISYQLDRLDNYYKSVIGAANPKAAAGITSDYVSKKKALQTELVSLNKAKKAKAKIAKEEQKENAETADIYDIITSLQSGNPIDPKKIRTKDGLKQALTVAKTKVASDISSSKVGKKGTYKLSKEEMDKLDSKEIAQVNKISKAFAIAGMGNYTQAFAKNITAGMFDGEGMVLGSLPVDAPDDNKEAIDKVRDFLSDTGVSKAEIKRVIDILKKQK